jgi:hypothetical protein
MYCAEQGYDFRGAQEVTTRRDARSLRTPVIFHQQVEVESLFRDALIDAVSLLFVGAGIKLRLQGFDLFEQLHFLWNEIGILQNRVSHSQMFGCGKVSFEINRLTLAGQIIKLPFGYRLLDLRFDETL